MATTTNLSTLKINYLTQAQYDEALANDEIQENELYFISDSLINGQIKGVLPSMDVSTLTEPGVYALTTSNTYTNLPSGITNGTLEVVIPINNANVRIHRLTTPNFLYVNYYTASAWQGWKTYVPKEKNHSFGISVQPTATLHNCTGTLTNSIKITQAANGTLFVHGRVSITSFVRSSNNPGINITLPDFVPTPTSTLGFSVGFQSELPRETVSINFTSGSRTASIITTESYANTVNGTLTFQISGTFYI